MAIPVTTIVLTCNGGKDIACVEQRGKKIVKSQMEQYRTREYEPAEVHRCHPLPHTGLQTAYTQCKDDGGHTQQSYTRSEALVQARSRQHLRYVIIMSLNRQ